MKKILLAINADNPVRTRAAVEEAIRIYEREQATVHLLNVQPLVSGHAAMCFAPGELRGMQLAAGQEDLRPAETLLAAAGVPYVSRVMVGRSAETIARAASELGCDRILVGEVPSAPLGSRIFGSLAQQLRHLVASTGGCEVIGS